MNFGFYLGHGHWGSLGRDRSKGEGRLRSKYLFFLTVFLKLLQVSWVPQHKVTLLKSANSTYLFPLRSNSNYLPSFPPFKRNVLIATKSLVSFLTFCLPCTLLYSPFISKPFSNYLCSMCHLFPVWTLNESLS